MWVESGYNVAKMAILRLKKVKFHIKNQSKVELKKSSKTGSILGVPINYLVKSVKEKILSTTFDIFILYKIPI